VRITPIRGNKTKIRFIGMARSCCLLSPVGEWKTTANNYRCGPAGCQSQNKSFCYPGKYFRFASLYRRCRTEKAAWMDKAHLTLVD
jgi:hypothetical protein